MLSERPAIIHRPWASTISREALSRSNPCSSLDPMNKFSSTKKFDRIMSFVLRRADAVVMLWTFQNPKRNALFMVTTNRLLLLFRSVACGQEAWPGDDFQEE